MEIMSTKRIILLPILSLTLLIGLGLTSSPIAETKEASSNWMPIEIAVNGSLDEWKDMPTTFFEEERLIIGIGNDSKFLYIFLRTDQADIIRTIQMSGISLWLDSKGKKKKDLCFHYRGGPTMEEIRDAGLTGSDKFKNRMSEEQRQRMMEQTDRSRNKITLTDKTLDFQEIIPIDGSYGPTIEYAFDHGFCVYEISVPLQDHLVDYFGFNAEPGQKVSIGIKWGGSPDGMRKGDPSGGMSVGGIGTGPGGKSGGGRGGMGGGRGGRMRMPESKEVWVKTILATPVLKEQEDN